jgi:YVTN family beta-propeller protein
LDVIDTKSLEILKTIPAETRLHDIVASSDSKYAAATSPNGKFVRVFDLQSQQMLWEVKFDQGTLVPAIEAGPDGSPLRIFVQLAAMNGFAVVDFAKRQEVARIKFPEDEASMPSSGPPSHGIGISPDNKTLWVISGAYDAVFEYSLPDLKMMGRVNLPKVEVPGRAAVGGMPNWVAFTPDNKSVYVSNEGDRSVSAIDRTTMKVVARIPVGEAPGRMNTLVLH